MSFLWRPASHRAGAGWHGNAKTKRLELKMKIKKPLKKERKKKEGRVKFQLALFQSA